MIFHPPMGKWRERRADNEARRQHRDDDYNDSELAQVRAARKAHYAELDRLGQIEADKRAAEALKLRVSCPCCAGSADGVLATHAELIIRAVAALGEGTRSDDWNMRRLHMIAVGADDGHLIIPASLSYPKPIAKPADTAAETVVEPAKVTPKTEPLIPSKRKRALTPAEAHAEADGAVIEDD
ncbi:hypothetical protein [Methylobacterium brachiatum]|uniref:hypothetical protein n=1 Tax=Methylobacterium brachiatum TaxID=269660 RepID=UPI000EFD4014|nr:hypothetical protein [Methylobacterium brachiatum]AYO84050.1 hypothetical protein EBB05_18455 [Methylobacterium brachiatum]